METIIGRGKKSQAHIWDEINSIGIPTKLFLSFIMDEKVPVGYTYFVIQSKTLQFRPPRPRLSLPTLSPEVWSIIASFADRKYASVCKLWEQTIEKRNSEQLKNVWNPLLPY